MVSRYTFAMRWRWPEGLRLSLVGPRSSGCLVVAVSLTIAGCGGQAPPPPRPSACSANLPAPSAVSATDALRGAQEVLGCLGAYRVAVQGHNFVLPEWGGVDAGIVVVEQSGATAQLARTGDGLYYMVLADNATFYRRFTCPHWERRSGGAPAVLRPFLLAQTGALMSAVNPVVVGTSRSSVTIMADISVIGEAHVTVSVPMGFLLKLTWGSGTDSGSWSFSRVAVPLPPSTPPPGPAPDQGPGGNPC